MQVYNLFVPMGYFFCPLISYWSLWLIFNVALIIILGWMVMET
jgi:hypothetical protein